MPSVLVIGAGITGLTTTLTLFHDNVDVQLIEANDRVGGKVLTTAVRGTQIDAGPDAFLVRDPHMTELCEELNLALDLVAPATGRAFVWVHGALRPLPRRQFLGVPLDLADLEPSGLLTPEGVARARQDLQDPPNAPCQTSLWGRSFAVGSATRSWTGWSDRSSVASMRATQTN